MYLQVKISTNFKFLVENLVNLKHVEQIYVLSLLGFAC
jgi:hypothetical protein